MNNYTIPKHFGPVIEALPETHLVAWDTCHKIYMALDEEQAEWFRENYDPDIVEGTMEQMLAALIDWWGNSCSLRFINGVRTNHADPNAGYEDLIPQFVDDEDES